MFWAIVFAMPTALVVWRLLRIHHPLDELPGPRRLPFIGCPLVYAYIDRRQLFNQLRQLFKLYGDRHQVQIFNRRIVNTSNPGDVEVILSHSKNISKSKSYSFLQPWLGNGLLLSTGEKWHSRRKILTPTFHFNILRKFSVVMQEKTAHLLDKLQRTSGSDVDVMQEISDVTLFIICETAMGTQLDKDKSARTVAYKKAIYDIGQLMVDRVTKWWLHVDFIFNLSSKKTRYDDCLRKVHQFADDVIQERRKQRSIHAKKFAAALENKDSAPVDMDIKKRLAMLDLLLEAEDKGEIDEEGIREEVNTFMFGGHDTTAMAIIYLLMLLADHEEVQERIYEESRAILGESNRPTGMADWAEMKYLDAVIKESLRLYPSAPLVARSITEDFVMGDLPVKKGTYVVVHLYDLHRRADLFPEPTQFRPERFLVPDTRHPYAYVPFSAGLRNCIGQKFARLEMKCIISELCRRFRLRPKTRGARPELAADLVLRPASPVYVQFIPR